MGFHLFFLSLQGQNFCLMKIIDRYIIRNFLGTLAFMLLLLSIIVIVIDVQSKSPRIEGNGFTVSHFLVHFYPFWIIHLAITFMSILVFISVIFFTSRLANNTEIVAVISSGASFHRFARPYFVSAGFIALLILVVNHFLLPWANIKKNELEPYTMNVADRTKIIGDTEISMKVSDSQYIFINSYNRKDKNGNQFLLQEFDKNGTLLKQIYASGIRWDEKKNKFILENFLERQPQKDHSEKLSNGDTKEISFGYPPEELFPNDLTAQTKTTPELIRYINQEIEKGNSNLNVFLNELHLRTSMPVAIIILTILGLSLASQKKRGGLGANLAIGISLAFLFVFSFEALKVVSGKNVLSPLLAMWLPNIIFAPIATILYFRRANQ